MGFSLLVHLVVHWTLKQGVASGIFPIGSLGIFPIGSLGSSLDT